MMIVRSVHDLAAAVRGRRNDLGLSQAELAARASVSRKWVYEFEGGKPKAEIGALLSVLDALGLVLEARTSDAAPAPAHGSRVDLDAVLGEYRDR
jgi:HTH-type transcriptional regulator / antitoxin HipB